MTFDKIRPTAYLLLALLCPTFAVAEPDNSVDARIARIANGLLVKGASQPASLGDRMRHYGVPGVSIALIHANRVEWTRAYGLADVASGQKLTPETLLQAASISKPVTALAALRLVEQGSLGLDRDVNADLRSWQLGTAAVGYKAPVTLRRVLNHSAGLSVPGFGGYESGQAVPTLRQILDGAAPSNSPPVRRVAEPGTEWSYSGGGYEVLQALLEEHANSIKQDRLSGHSFPDLMNQLVLGPAEMSQSYFEQPLSPARVPQAASGHDERGQVINGRWRIHPELAAAGLWTTPRDLARFAIKLQEALAGKPGSLLTQAMAEQMMTPVLGNFGLGVGLKNDGANLAFGHLGGNVGYRCAMLVYARNGQGVIIMTNGENGLALVNEITPAIAAEYGWPTERGVR